MPWLFARISYGHLFDEGADVEAFDVVGVVEVVAKIVFREVEWDEEARMVWGYAGGSDEGDCEFGTTACQLNPSWCIESRIQMDFLAAEGY
jgi:hypothetical protein